MSVAHVTYYYLCDAGTAACVAQYTHWWGPMLVALLGVLGLGVLASCWLWGQVVSWGRFFAYIAVIGVVGVIIWYFFGLLLIPPK